jgi:two-component system OmpR family sensor kinase
VRNRSQSIVVPMMLLVIAAALVVTLVQFAVTFKGPGPGPGPVPIERVAEALRTGRSITVGKWPRVLVSRSTSGRFGRPDESSLAARDAAIAALIPSSVGKIRGYYEWHARDPEEDIRGTFTVAMQTANGWIVASSAPRPIFTHWHFATLSAMLITIAILSLFAWGLARRISRPIRELADAAKRARLGAPVSIPMRGPREVQALGEAIGAMQSRILQQAEGRAAMVAAIAHDLGTPLSRIAFWIEQLPDAARERASADIDEMRKMVGAAVRFVRDDRAETAHTRLDLGSLIDTLADDLEIAGTPVDVQAGPRAVVRGDPQSLRRLFANLVENAVRYGERARIGWTLQPGWVEAVIDDDGPGFDPVRAESLFSPFVRGESSRNRTTGGTGLGLAIVRSIAEAHGGQVTLENRGDGGRVRVRLPAE